MSYHHKIPCKYWGKRKKKIQKLHNLNLQANTELHKISVHQNSSPFKIP